MSGLAGRGPPPGPLSPLIFLRTATGRGVSSSPLLRGRQWTDPSCCGLRPWVGSGHGGRPQGGVRRAVPTCWRPRRGCSPRLRPPFAALGPLTSFDQRVRAPWRLQWALESVHTTPSCKLGGRLYTLYVFQGCLGHRECQVPSFRVKLVSWGVNGEPEEGGAAPRGPQPLP